MYLNKMVDEKEIVLREDLRYLTRSNGNNVIRFLKIYENM